MTDPDPAAAVERTRLAWERSALTALVGGALLVFRTAGPELLVAGAAGLALALGLGVLGRRRARSLGGLATARSARRPVLVAGFGTAVFGLVTLGALVLGGPGA